MTKPDRDRRRGPMFLAQKNWSRTSDRKEASTMGVPVSGRRSETALDGNSGKRCRVAGRKALLGTSKNEAAMKPGEEDTRLATLLTGRGIR